MGFTSFYLSLFFNEESSFYYDFQFLFYVVDGFNYLYKDIFGNDNVSRKTITSVLCEHDSEVREKNEKSSSEDIEYTNSDFVLVYSLKLAMAFKDRNLLDNFNDLVQTVLFNSYVIREETKKEERDFGKVVYWKQFPSQAKNNNLLS